MGTPHPIKPALGSLRSSENWQQCGIREFFNSLLSGVQRQVDMPKSLNLLSPKRHLRSIRNG
jgi:hypothetical protein